MNITYSLYDNNYVSLEEDFCIDLTMFNLRLKTIVLVISISAFDYLAQGKICLHWVIEFRTVSRARV